MMITIKTIQTSFIPAKDATTTIHLLNTRRLTSKKNPLLCFCKAASNGDGGGSEDASQPPEGDIRRQEALAKIMMLQTQKVRLTDFLDEKSAYITQFAEEANAEMDQLGENALKGLDEAEERIMGNIDKQMQAFEEAAELERAEIENTEKQVAEFEGQIEEDRNEGLFFKNLREQKEPVDKVKAMEETNKIKEITKASAGSKTRKNIYLALMGLLVIGIADAVTSSSSPDWRKIVVIALVLLGLLSQFIYEQKFSSSEKESADKDKD